MPQPHPLAHVRARPRTPKQNIVLAVARAALPAYLFPFATSFPGALVTGDAELRAASTTTIPIPGVIAAVCVVFATRALESRLPEGARVGRVSATAIALVACGLVGLVAVGALVRLGVLSESAFGYACPSSAIGGGVTALSWARRRLKEQAARPTLGALALGTLALVTALGASSGCATPMPRITGEAPYAVAERSSPPSGVSGESWVTFQAAHALCADWARVADDEAAVHRSRQSTAGVLSAIAGAFGTAAGISTGVVSGKAASDGDDGKAARVGQVGGMTALGFGLLAGVAGMYGNKQGNGVAEAMSVAVGIDRALHARMEALLASPEGLREAAVVKEGTSLVIACARAARRLPSLASLPVSRSTPPNVVRAVEMACAGAPAEAVESALFLGRSRP